MRNVEVGQVADAQDISTAFISALWIFVPLLRSIRLFTLPGIPWGALLDRIDVLVFVILGMVLRAIDILACLIESEILFTNGHGVLLFLL